VGGGEGGEPVWIAEAQRDRDGNVGDSLELVEGKLRAVRWIDFRSHLWRRDPDHSPRSRPPEREEHSETILSEKEMPRVGDDSTVDFDIPEHERLWVDIALEGDSGCLPNEAMRPIASGHKGRAESLFAAIAVQQGA